MSRINYITFSFLFFFSMGYSQYYYRPVSVCEDCYASIEVGVLQSTISGLSDSSSKTGFYAGFFQFKPINDKFAFRSGITYNNIGANIKNFDTPLVIHSINIPLSLHYRLKEYLQIFGGGEIGTNFFGKLPQNENSTANVFYNNSDLNDKFTLIDASAFLGVGYILKNNIDINLKYNLGLTSINELDNLDKEVWKKNYLTLSIGYTFREE